MARKSTKRNAGRGRYTYGSPAQKLSAQFGGKRRIRYYAEDGSGGIVRIKAASDHAAMSKAETAARKSGRTLDVMRDEGYQYPSKIGTVSGNPARSLPVGKKVPVYAKRLRNGRIELYR